MAGDVGDGFDELRRRYAPVLRSAQIISLNERTVLRMANDGPPSSPRFPGSRKMHFLREKVFDTLKASRDLAGPTGP